MWQRLQHFIPTLWLWRNLCHGWHKNFFWKLALHLSLMSSMWVVFLITCSCFGRCPLHPIPLFSVFSMVPFGYVQELNGFVVLKVNLVHTIVWYFGLQFAFVFTMETMIRHYPSSKTAFSESPWYHHPGWLGIKNQLDVYFFWSLALHIFVKWTDWGACLIQN